MAYYIDVHESDLTRTDMTREIEEVGETYVHWSWNEGNAAVEVDEEYFKWDSEFINDLVKLAKIGVEGRVTTRGEEGEYTLFVLDNGEVEEYEGQVIFPDIPTTRHTEIKESSD